ncbi:85/88 kDa calcium-independent phospholipase A2 [Osmia bicornis bicornis]|uniref:85/88 kDa calcium-independent phospholipase A2 n=1 Tax=Osmia bicornis bicornis TaxID=1437191 RepID=UPI0010F85D80|nr:85/88 kDa calcium-independent phospholipase A2 [Osmia bicornis bicornis]
MAWLGTIASNVFRNIMSSDVSPNLVLEVKPENYSNRHILCREDGIVLYAPGERHLEKYEIVLHRPCTETLHQAYSLFRSVDKSQAEGHFIIYKDKVPVLVQICREMCNVSKIQKLCDTLVQHPSWTLAHLAAHFALCNAFAHTAVNSQLNSGDIESGVSPLQVAVQSNNLRTVQMLIEAKSSLEHLDNNANTVYHFAATSTKEIILALGGDLPNSLNSRNCNGHTPLHVACLNNKPECVKALLLIGADVNIPASEGEPSSPSYVGDFLHSKPNVLHAEDMKFGGTPLHWSLSREVINALIESNCDIDALNFDGRTALHIMAMRKRLPCVVALLSHMASVNIVDKDGNTPLHLAVSEGTLAIVQSLIGFGADIDARNWKSESPRHRVNIDSSEGQRILYVLNAVGAQRCPPEMTNCNLGCKLSESFDGIAPRQTPKVHPRTILDQMLHVSGMDKMATQGNKRIKGGRLLCLDGGGIRGLVLVQMLLEIESVLGKPVVDCFDWIAGTSTGGILALGLALGKSLRECQALYFRIKEEAFVGMRPYNSEDLERVLKDSLGAETVMSDIEKPKIMITGVLADKKPVDLYLFRNYESPSTLLKIPIASSTSITLSPPNEQLVWHVARATGAAPTYFKSFGKFLDGGLIANNPTLDAMTEIHEYNLALKATGREQDAVPLSLVVSLGTGLPPTTQLKDIDTFIPESIWGTAKLAMGISILADLLVDQATATDGRVVDRARNWCSMIGVPYYRFNPQLCEDVAMDEKNDEILADMIWIAQAFMHANRDQIRELAAVINRDVYSEM